MRRLSLTGKLLLSFILLMIVGPFIPLGISSVAFRWGWPDLLPSIWWWEKRDQVYTPLAWDYILDPVSRIIPAMGNTLLIAGAVTLISLALAIPAARVLGRQAFKGKSVMELFFASPLIVPEIATGIGIYLIFTQTGLQGTLIAIILSHLVPVLPYLIRVLTGIYSEMDESLLDQATLLGAGPLQRFIHVEFPLILPGVMAAALFAILISTNIFLLTFYMGQGQVETLATILFSKLSGGGSLDPVSAGLTLIVALPGILFLMFTHRLIREEVFAGGTSRG
ncbi:MAG: ABC transporter permease subunit [Sneathiella sp.]|nr:ABC transporter permease subunit [Sneathiella sp.]